MRSEVLSILRSSAELGSYSSRDTPSCAPRSQRRASASRCRVVERTVDLPWREEDLRGQPAESKRRTFVRSLEQERARGFDLAHAPLLRLILVRLDDEPLPPSLDHAPPLHRRLVVADRVQGSRGDLRRRSQAGSDPVLPEAVPVRTLHPLALARGRRAPRLSGRQSLPVFRSRRLSILAYADVGEDESPEARDFHTVAWPRPSNPAVRRAAEAGDHEQRCAGCVGPPAQPLQRLDGRRLRRRVLRPTARAPRHRRTDRAVREQRTGARPHLPRGASRHGGDSAPTEAAGPEPAPVRLPRTDPGLGRHPIAPSSLREPPRLPELRRRRVCLCSYRATHDFVCSLVPTPRTTRSRSSQFPGRL